MYSFLIFIWATLLVGNFSFGGGKAYIPMFKFIYIDSFKLVSSLELTEFVGYAIALPGPVAPMIAGPIGYNLFGWTGFIGALLALTVTPLILFFYVYKIFKKNMDNTNLQRVSTYMRPAIMALLLYVCIDSVLIFSQGNRYLLYSLIVFILSSIVLIKTKIHPILLIILAGFVGFYIN